MFFVLEGGVVFLMSFRTLIPSFPAEQRQGNLGWDSSFSFWQRPHSESPMKESRDARGDVSESDLSSASWTSDI